jgi:hypothetical protein
MMGGPMAPVHMVEGRLRVDPAARPRRVTVVVEHGVDDDGEEVVRAQPMIAVRRKSGWRVYVDLPLDHRTISRGPATFFLYTTGPLDPRDEHVMWCWGWRSEAAKALAVSWALR